jgi:hypothetical protein
MRALMLAAALLAAGCHVGNTLDNSGPSSPGGGGGGGEGRGGGGGNSRIDMAGLNFSTPDLASTTVSTPDLSDVSETCGAIVTCAITCLGNAGGGTGGLGGLAGCQSCLTGAPPEATMEAQAIFTCAITNCLSDITGGGGTAGIFQCLTSNCTTELAACQGLGLGGF